MCSNFKMLYRKFLHRFIRNLAYFCFYFRAESQQDINKISQSPIQFDNQNCLFQYMFI